jgi:hypothetical protein
VAAFFVAFLVVAIVCTILPVPHYETKQVKDKPKKLKNVSKCVGSVGTRGLDAQHATRENW